MWLLENLGKPGLFDVRARAHGNLVTVSCIQAVGQGDRDLDIPWGTFFI